MANQPCPNKIDCECADGNPLSNFSSEIADDLSYREIAWVILTPRIGQDPTIDPNNPPPSLCSDPRSPLYAWLCAKRKPPTVGNPLIGTSTGNELFYNTVAQCDLPCPDGNVTRVQVGAGEFAGYDPYTPDRQAAALACELAFKARICLSDITGAICEGTFHADSIVATTAIRTFQITSGMLPPGLNLGRLNNFTLSISGTPTTPGTFVFTLHVTNPVGGDMTKTYTISVLGIVNDSPLPEATEGTPYAEILTGDGGTPGYSFAVSAGAMPSGLILDPTGFLNGIPSESGDFTFTIEITDSAATPQTCSKDFTLHVVPGNVPGAWYPFEDAAPPPFVDSQNAIPMVIVAGSFGFVNQGVGKVGPKCLNVQTNAGVTMTQNPSATSMDVATGFTITGWIAHVNFPLQTTSYLQLIYRNYNGIWSDPANPGEPVVLEAVLTRSSTQWEIILRNGVGVNLVTPIIVVSAFAVNTWYFFSIRYDRTGTGRLYFSVNGGAETASVDTYAAAIANQAGRLMLATSFGGIGVAVQSDWDELNYWDHSLSAAEIAAIYNGGAGRTWP